MENQVWHPLAHSRLRYTRRGTLQPTRPGIFQVLWPEHEEGHTGEPYGLHHLVNHTFQHIFTHILGPLSGLGGIPVLRRPSPPPKQRFVGPSGSTH